ncbi:hypothetical protein BH20ACI1_BH20ACI1_00510 [soil metagenome]
MVTFCKSAMCPSSENLLAFQTGEVSTAENERVEAHLAVCEFCASEVEFYTRYPPAEESVATVEIPLPLYELAHALLNIKHKDYSVLNELFSEKVIN